MASWGNVTTLPYIFSNGAAVVVNDEIHIIGGTSSDNKHYKCSNGVWSSVSIMPSYGFYYRPAVVLPDAVRGYDIYYLGSEMYQNKSYSYWTGGTGWSEDTKNLPYAFKNGGAVVLDGEIHILGGYDSSNRSSHYKRNKSTGSWSSVSTLPYSFYQGSAVVLNNEIHILGGTGTNLSQYHYKYSNGSWVEVSTLPYNFYRGAAVVLNNEIHILGGYSNSTNHYKYSNGSWVEVSTLPFSFYSGSAVVLDDEIHILGSSNTDGSTKHCKYHQNPINKVIYGDDTLLDLTSDTVVRSALLSGYVAHNSSGVPIFGDINLFSLTPSADGAYFQSGYLNAQTSGYAYPSRIIKTGTWEQTSASETTSISISGTPKIVIFYKDMDQGANAKASMVMWFSDDSAVYRYMYNVTSGRVNLGTRNTSGYSRYAGCITSVSSSSVGFTGVSTASYVGTWNYIIVY